MNSKRFLESIEAEPRVLSSKEIRTCLEEADSLWLYEADPTKSLPHALLTSGKHSNGFVNVGAVLRSYPGVRRSFAQSIISKLYDVGVGDRKFTRVVGADTSSTDLAADIAEITSTSHIRMLKREDGEGKRQVWHPDNMALTGKDIVLHIEELITTSLSALLVREGIRCQCRGIHFVPFLPVVVGRWDSRNPVHKVEESTVLPLLRLNIRNYDADRCPYCAVGSEAIKPKEGDNWSRLMAQE